MVSHTAEYALRAMACLATFSNVVTTPVLAEKARIPTTYLAKVLQQLAGAKLIRGRRGVGGGYLLAKTPKEISLMQIILAVDGGPELLPCTADARGKVNGNGSKFCPLHRYLDEANKAYAGVVETATLQDLLNEGDGKTPACFKRKSGRL